jgi:signal peptidase I
MRDNAANWLQLADKVCAYRRDQLTAAQLAELLQASGGLRQKLKERADASRLKLGIEELEGVLRKTGGRIYPKSSLVENIEFFVVAAIVILGIRAYLFQPFKIPTNSMWPTYHGMTADVYPNLADAPGPVLRAVRFVLFGARHREVVAPESGEIVVPVNPAGYLGCDRKNGRDWLVLPSVNREYVFYVNETPVSFQVPADFDFDVAFHDAFGVTREQLAARARQSTRGNSLFRWVVLDRAAVRGRPMLSFDILTGDQLFVDRISYHFRRPAVGEGFVFRTGNITSPEMQDAAGRQIDQYYIKRLVGAPSDVLEVKEPVLWRNGRPITGAAAFSKNARREGLYPGYQAMGLLAPSVRVTVPPRSFLAMGDNSPNSKDGRYWGFVPEKDVVGRPLFIYFPFTKRWGPAQ